MKEKSLLEKMSFIDTELIEEARHIEPKRRIKRSGWIASAACLLIMFSIAGATYATNGFEAIRSYFTGETTEVQNSLLSSDISAADGEFVMSVDHIIADEKVCWFTLSMAGIKDTVATNDMIECVTLLKEDGTSVSNLSIEVGAYISEKFETGFGNKVPAVSLYDDADATFLIGCYMPKETTTSDYSDIRVSYNGLQLNIQPQDYMVESYELKSNESDAPVRNFTASSIRFSFDLPAMQENTDDDIAVHIALIKKDGTYLTEKDDAFVGYGLSTESHNAKSVHFEGKWGGQEGIALGILDMDQYTGIQVNGVDYYFL